jgi:ribosomal protein S16
LSSFVVNYSVDGGATVSETITGLSVLPNRTAIYRFNTTFNSTGLGSHDVKVWITTTGDSIRANDTMMFKYNVQVPIGTFSSYNFNDLRLPLNWTAVTPMTFGTRGASPSDGGIAYRNLFTALARFEMQTNKFGVIRTTDSVSYEYRFVNFSGATATILGTDSVLVQYAFDCEDVWRTADLVTSANHNPSTLFVRRKVSLAAAAGRIILLRFVAIRGTTGDYYFDIDNINFISCAPNFGLATRFNNTPQGQSRGTAAVTPTNGLPPFTYRWNNTRTTDSIGALPAGIYTVVVTDARGCKDSTTVTVTGTIGTIDPTATIASLKIAPNPTTNNAVLDVEFAKAVDAKVEIVNLMGQTIWSESRRQISQGRFDLDMNDVPAGVYIVRVSADNRSVIAKLVKQ